MASRKRARTSSNGGGSSDSTAAALVELDGGEPCPSGLVKLWRSGRMTDTVVEVEGRSFAAHKNVLAAQCDYFNRHYDHEHMRDADHPKLLEHVTAAAFEPLLAFLYEGACTFDESLLAPVLQAAHYLGVAPLERAAVAAFSERLSPSNALAAWTWGEELELPELSEAAKETALQDFDEVIEKIEEATLAQVHALVADDRLTAKSEEAVFSAVARFAEAKQPTEAELFGLLRNVRFSRMSPSFLHDTVCVWPKLQTVAGQGMIIEMLAPRVSGPAQQPRTGFGARYLYVMGGAITTTSGAYVSSVDIYDAHTNQWVAGTPMPTARGAAAAVPLGGKIYVMGRYPAIASVDVFDPNSMGAWAAAAPMAKCRANCAAAVVGGKLYAIGGTDSSSVEAFDPQTGAWAVVAPMPAARGCMGAAVADGKIYVVGGYGAVGTAFATVEVYDPQTNTWAVAPPMGKGRKFHCVAALGGKIYAAGGFTASIAYLNTVEAFDPATNSWSAVAPMSTARSHFSLQAAGGKLYAVGGKARDDAVITTVEAYDPLHDRWEAVAPMSRARQSASAVCMP